MQGIDADQQSSVNRYGRILRSVEVDPDTDGSGSFRSTAANPDFASAEIGIFLVPEPTTAALLALAGLVVRRGRARAA